MNTDQATSGFEKVTVEQAVQKLSETNNNNNTRLTDLEKKLNEIYMNMTGENREGSNNLSNEITNLQNTMKNQIEAIQTQTRQWQDTTKSRLEENQQDWNRLTNNVQDLKAEIQKIGELITGVQVADNDHEQIRGNRTITPHTDHNTSRMNESFDTNKFAQRNTTHHTQSISFSYLFKHIYVDTLNKFESLVSWTK
uniref:Uncharacterized protein n=1 Tax=Adineta vaga TaxID=104782 RepID=B3G4D4_ADIVA|nr:hypothetical protein [Adineta vaga]